MNQKTLKLLEYDKILEKLASYAASDLGRELIYAVEPVNDPDVIKQKLKETDDALVYILKRGKPSFGGLHDIRGLFRRLELGAILGPGELLKISGVLRLCRNLKGRSRDDAKRLEDENLIILMIENLQISRDTENEIERCVLNEEDLTDDASQELRNIRRQIGNQRESIKDKLNNIIRSPKYQKYIQESIVTIRQGRYVVPVKQEYRSEIQGLIHDSSSSGATLYIEPMGVVEANNNIKELLLKERVEIEKILARLSGMAAEFLPGLMTDMEILAKLDFFTAKASFSLSYDGSTPLLNRNKRIVLRSARHPLLDRNQVVPVDFFMKDDITSTIITGPNTGGKTVTLKTVGLLTLMAQSGLNIPANDNSEISVFDRIFADIGDEQSIEQSLSTFSSHMTNISGILEKADMSSLVLLDELGAGTDPDEGAALAISILEFLHRRGSVVVATTHYSELKLYGISSGYTQNASCEFNVETLRPTYKLLIGIPGKSNAFAISRKLGVPGEIIENAAEYLSKENIRFEDVLLSMENDRKKADEYRMEAERLKKNAESIKKELDEEKNKLNELRENMIRKARQEARQILVDAQKEAEEAAFTIKKSMDEIENQEKLKALEQMKNNLKNKVNSVDEALYDVLVPKESYIEPPKDLKAGDSVLILNLNQKGIVLEPPGNSKEAMIQAGIMKINVHVSNLRLIDEQKARSQSLGAGLRNKTKTISISPEIDLRGNTLEEAIDKMDKYIDDASLTGLIAVTIIHGKGTGVLRSGIHRHLKNHPQVASFRQGKFGEGESGVTIIELKNDHG